MTTPDLLAAKEGFVGPTFSLKNRLRRAVWLLAWAVLARWTPAPAHRWRIAVLRAFGAKVSWRAYVYGSARIWAPWNLVVENFGTIGPEVTVYNIAPVLIGEKAVVSQRAHLCTGTHDYRDPTFPLFAKPIEVRRRAWVCAQAFVGPGVIVEDGAVLAAAGVAFARLDAWTVYVGNPAVVHGSRTPISG